LPITIDTGEIVDPVPAGGGMINGNTKLGFDARGRVVIGYHKYDANGNTQIYNARRERDGWKIYQSTDWDYRWDFQGGGSIRFQVGLGPVTVGSDGTLTQRHSCSKYGGGQWVLDPDTLRATEKTQAEEILPREIGRVRSEHPGMGVRTASDLGASGNSNRRYLLRWESRGSNRDRPFLGEPPKPSMLQLYELRKVR